MTAGDYEVIKEKLMDLIVATDSTLSPKASHVFGEWRIESWQMESSKMPIVTVRLGPETINETVYGRKLKPSQKGHFVTFFFTAHVWHTQSTTTGTTKAKKALDLSDKIITYLEKYNGDDTSGICFFRDVTARESDSETGPQLLSRCIIEGYIEVKRPHT